MQTTSPILVIASTGKTGRRVADRLEAQGQTVRRGSRSGAPGTTRFDWDQPDTWTAALEGARAAYVVYSPDLAVPSAPGAIRAFTQRAAELGVEHLVLLSGRGEEEAQAAESILQSSGLGWTIVRASWFAQNFDEGAFHELILSGTVALPVDQVPEPFIDADDIADVVVAALTEEGHAGQLYEVTGPRLMTFADAVAEIASATGRELNFVPITLEDFRAGLQQAELPTEQVELLDYLFTNLFDGRNARTTDGVTRALGRPARDFGEYARRIAEQGAWTPSQTTV